MTQEEMATRIEYWNALPLKELNASFRKAMLLSELAGIGATGMIFLGIFLPPVLFGILLPFVMGEILLLTYGRKPWCRILMFIICGIYIAGILVKLSILGLIFTIITLYCLCDKHLFSTNSLTTNQLRPILLEREKGGFMTAEKLQELSKHQNMFLSYQMIFLYVAMTVNIISYFVRNIFF